MPTWIMLLAATVIAAVGGYRASRMPHVQRITPRWLWWWFWLCIFGLFVVVPVVWWLDLP